MTNQSLSSNEDSLKRLRLSKILTIVGALALLASYVMGVFFEYQPPEGYELEINQSYQPFSMFSVKPMGEEGEEHGNAHEEGEGGEEEDEYDRSSRWDMETVKMDDKTLGAFLGGYHSMPIWLVSLESAQYPKSAFPYGIPVYFNLTRFTGEVTEMNTINHYIGMHPMEVGAPFVRKMVPLIYLAFFASLAVFYFYSGPVWWLFGLGPALMPVYFVGWYSYWLYWFGHNLMETRAFDIKPFMPTVFGDGKVAQFGTHSYPTTGFYVLLIAFIALLLAVLIKRRVIREMDQG